MLEVRHDKYAVGDKVVWSPHPFFRDRIKLEEYGEGPFEIKKVEDIGNPDAWYGMGHTQQLTLDISKDEDNTFSGAWFVKQTTA